MAYVLYTPPTRPGAAFTPTSGVAKRAIGRIVGPLRVGVTQFRIDDVWFEKSTPSTTESLAADLDTDGTRLFLRGGHWHWLREEILDEMDAAGLDIGEHLLGLYLPFYPSADAYPGA